MTPPKPAELLATLSESQQSTYLSFRYEAESAGLLIHPSGARANDSLYGMCDDKTILRFLAARKFDTEKALNFFRQANEIRESSRLCQFYESLNHELFQETAKLYPQWTGRRDKRGLPLSLFDVANVSGASIAAHKKSSKTILDHEILPSPGGKKIDLQALRAYSVHDYLTRFVMPLCAAVAGSPTEGARVSKQVVIADLSTLSWRQVWDLKGYMQDFSSLLSSEYPETLDCVLCVGCSSSVSALWGWVKSWIDPVTAAKLQVIPPDKVQSTLTTLIDIDDIPQKYGGTLPFEVGMAPMLDKQISDAVKWIDPSQKVFPRAPMLWTSGRDTPQAAVVTGTLDGKQVDQEIATL